MEGVTIKPCLRSPLGRALFFVVVLFSLLGWASPKVDDFLQAEQKRNIKNIYKADVFQNDLPEMYRAENSPSFNLPYYLIPLDSPELRQFSSGPMPEVVHRHHIVTRNGIAYFKLPVHPATLAYHQEIFKDRFEFIPATRSEIKASPTASERALVVEPTDSPAYMVKVNLPLLINNRDRTMYPTEVRRGIWLTTVMAEKLAKNPKLSKRLFIFPESFGVYPRIENKAIGGMIFREFPKEFFNTETEVMPLFSFLAVNPATGKPLFFEYIPAGMDPAQWFHQNILDPLLEVVNEWTYKEGISFELHSQNTLIEVNKKTKTLTGRFGYRDLASAHLDLRLILMKGQEIPRLDLISDPQRELGFAYLKERELYWLRYFLKSQISDLFFIQMAAHGLITREQREALKNSAWEKIIDNHKTHYINLENASQGSQKMASLPDTLKTYLFDEKTDEKNLSYKILKGDFGLAFGPTGEIVGVVFPKRFVRQIRCEKVHFQYPQAS